MNPSAIEFHHVTKSFLHWNERPYSIKEILVNVSRLRLSRGKAEQRMVLRNLHFTIHKGEFVGIMGRNGAGKSTLLKLISGIFYPTSGHIVAHGRVAPLLELGAGFSTDLTGFENIFLNASILGFSRKQVLEKVDAIIAFADLGDALNYSIRKYSSGMLVRLGFSIAVHLDAQILLFDEVLGVGDIGFQQKCLKKINEVHAEGRTIILVTHAPEQVEEFCDRCIVFDHQGVIFDGAPEGGAVSYRSLFAP